MPVEVCTDHTGKMEGIKSLSTSVLLNPNCQHNQEIKGSICEHCYAECLAKMYSALGARLARNTATLIEPLSDVDIISTDGEEIFRLEAFGDLNNTTQLDNYMRIVQSNPNTRFTLYTKMYTLVEEYFTTHKAPDNFTLVISSMMVNLPMHILYEKLKNNFALGQLKVFTVYNKEYIAEHPELKINCGSKACNKCRICYNKNSIVYVNEILKSDRNAAEAIINWRDPKYVEETAHRINEIFGKWR